MYDISCVFSNVQVYNWLTFPLLVRCRPSCRLSVDMSSYYRETFALLVVCHPHVIEFEDEHLCWLLCLSVRLLRYAMMIVTLGEVSKHWLDLLLSLQQCLTRAKRSFRQHNLASFALCLRQVDELRVALSSLCRRWSLPSSYILVHINR